MRHLGFLGTLMSAVLLIAAGQAQSRAPAKQAADPATPSGRGGYTLPNVVTLNWVGDLDGMIKRRQIRILTAYSKTCYFVNRAVQRGVAYDPGQLLEADLNKTLKAKHVRVRVLMVPVNRDELIPALLEGRGDVAMANLTITPERLSRWTSPIPSSTRELLGACEGVLRGA